MWSSRLIFLFFAIHRVLGDAVVEQVPNSYSYNQFKLEDASSTSLDAMHGVYQSVYGLPKGSEGVSSKPGYQSHTPKPVYGPPPAPTYTVEQTPYRGYGLDSESPFVQKRLFNTAVSLTVPLFSFVLPQRSNNNGSLDLANQAIFVAFSIFVIILTFAVPVLFTNPPGFQGRSSSSRKILDHLMKDNKIFNFMNSDVSNRIGFDTTKCLQKTICEAHRSPKKYGLLASPLLMFFPPPSNKMSEADASIFRLAAKTGKSTKDDCSKAYNCLFDIMDLSSYVLDWWKHPGKSNYRIEL